MDNLNMYVVFINITCSGSVHIILFLCMLFRADHLTLDSQKVYSAERIFGGILSADFLSFL